MKSPPTEGNWRWCTNVFSVDWWQFYQRLSFSLGLYVCEELLSEDLHHQCISHSLWCSFWCLFKESGPCKYVLLWWELIMKVFKVLKSKWVNIISPNCELSADAGPGPRDMQRILRGEIYVLCPHLPVITQLVLFCFLSGSCFCFLLLNHISQEFLLHPWELSDKL